MGLPASAFGSIRRTRSWWCGSAAGSSFCEFNGHAAYFDIVGSDGRVARRAAWGYPDPWPGSEGLRDHVALYADGLMSAGSTTRWWCRSPGASTAAGSLHE